jgi:hypothetical protein
MEKPLHRSTESIPINLNYPTLHFSAASNPSAFAKPHQDRAGLARHIVAPRRCLAVHSPIRSAFDGTSFATITGVIAATGMATASCKTAPLSGSSDGLSAIADVRVTMSMRQL